jgi:2-oxoglutarate ferredoxin oxidoreductase subunit alpha
LRGFFYSQNGLIVQWYNLFVITQTHLNANRADAGSEMHNRRKQPHDEAITIGIGGAAGDGVREAGQSLGTMLADLGYEVYVSFSYPSLIKGGHNFSRITFSKEKVWNDHSGLDVLIALNEESVKLHSSEMSSAGVIFADKFEQDDIEKFGNRAVALTMSASSKELNAPPITRNSVALGATCYLLDLHYPAMQKVLQMVFKEKRLEANIKLADLGFEYMQKLGYKHIKTLGRGQTSENRELLDGNTAFARGLLAAGLDFYVAYPMTPATTILHYLAAQQASLPVRVIQPESELSVINMALGIAYAGKRVAIGSATGGFELMQEAFSFAGISELPLVVAISQRQGPATGVPTHSGQSDLRLAIHAGHGEFPRIVIAPGDPQESFKAGAEALNLAWKYQVPVIVLLDKILSEHSATVPGGSLNAKGIEIERGRLASLKNSFAASGDLTALNGEEYGRYELCPDGISPMAFPGTPNAVVKVNSYEHDQSGITTEDPEMVRQMIEKRFAKGHTILHDLHSYETVKVYGDPDAKNVITFWGSVKGPLLEAAKYFTKPYKLVQILWVEPFDSKKVAKELHGARQIINIECNHDAQMAGLIREKTGIEVSRNILKYDSMPLDSRELAKEIQETGD